VLELFAVLPSDHLDWLLVEDDAIQMGIPQLEDPIRPLTRINLRTEPLISLTWMPLTSNASAIKDR